MLPVLPACWIDFLALRIRCLELRTKRLQLRNKSATSDLPYLVTVQSSGPAAGIPDSGKARRQPQGGRVEPADAVVIPESAR
jgi:hypothetical protein